MEINNMRTSFVATKKNGETLRGIAHNLADFLTQINKEHGVTAEDITNISTSKAPAPLSLS
tara:strand:- start:21 stop:203 length:183 start_codon:yes stop_codon:yes gene_type:complete